MPVWPAGTVTFLFTDIEGSTRLHQRLGAEYAQLRRDHDDLLCEVIIAHNGVVVSNTGDGVFAAFAVAASGTAAAGAAQRALSRARFPHAGLLRVRMGLHTGEGVPKGGDYTAVAVHQAARVCAAAHGGQVLVTAETAAAAAHGGLRSLGLFRLKDFDDPIGLWQLTGEGLPDSFPAVRAMPFVRHNMPVIASSLIGRQDEAAVVSGLVEHEPVVTLTGPGGIGKTRLAVHVAGAVADSFPDGAWLVRLALVDQPEQVVQVLARTLGVREQQGALIETVAEALYGRRLMLVMDNCEHVIDAAAAAVGTLVARCPQLRVLATSREPMRLDGEVVITVHALDVPRPDSADDPLAAGSVALFVDRAARSGQVIGGDGLATVVEICRRVEGVPLAIELAAARLRHLSLAEIVARLTSQLQLLSGGSRTADPRQRALTATLDWSHRLLSPAEQALFRRLAVVQSAVTLEVAEAVCGDALPRDSATLDALTGLADKSLLYAADGSAPTAYRMLAVVREYAAERLRVSGEEEALRARHAAWVQTQLGHVVARYETSQAGQGLADWHALASDIDAALAWTVDHDVDSAVVLTTTALDMWFATGRLSEGVRWFDACLGCDIGAGARALLESAAGFFLVFCGAGNAVSRCQTGYEWALQAGDTGTISRTRGYLANSRMMVGDLDGAEPLLRDLVEANLPTGFNGMGALCYFRHDYVQACEWYRRAFDQAAAIGKLQWLPISQANLAEANIELGNYDEAGRLLDDWAWELRQRAGANLPLFLTLVSRVAQAQGRTADARAALTEATEAARRMGNIREADRLAAALDELASASSAST